MFSKTTLKKLSKVRLLDIVDLVKEKSPVMYQLLSYASRAPYSKQPVNDFAICIYIYMAIAIIVKERNSKASIFQKVISSLLYAGHAAKYTVSSNYRNSIQGRQEKIS